jgi:hypothetical protein
MKIVLKLFSLIGHEPIDGEFNSLQMLEDAAFQHRRSIHLSRRPTAAEPTTAGICFLVSLIGAPYCFVAGLLDNDAVYFFGAAFWSFLGVALYLYLAYAAKYWREHQAIRMEEVRRFGHTSFG